MSSLNINSLGKNMIAAAAGVFKSKWPDVRIYAEGEFRKLAQSLVTLSQGVATGKIKKSAAKSILKIHRNAAAMVMLAVEGLGILAVEAAINAALRAVASVVNKAAGFPLI